MKQTFHIAVRWWRMWQLGFSYQIPWPFWWCSMKEFPPIALHLFRRSLIKHYSLVKNRFEKWNLGKCKAEMANLWIFYKHITLCFRAKSSIVWKKGCNVMCNLNHAGKCKGADGKLIRGKAWGFIGEDEGWKCLLGIWCCLPFSVGRKHPYWTNEDLFLQEKKRGRIKAL